jgi:hypothetical protein
MTLDGNVSVTKCMQVRKPCGSYENELTRNCLEAAPTGIPCVKYLPTSAYPSARKLGSSHVADRLHPQILTRDLKVQVLDEQASATYWTRLDPNHATPWSVSRATRSLATAPTSMDTVLGVARAIRLICSSSRQRSRAAPRALPL